MTVTQVLVNLIREFYQKEDEDVLYTKNHSEKKENKIRGKISTMKDTTIFHSICLLIAFAFVFTSVAQAGTQEWNFTGANSDKDWEPATGKWSVQDGEYSQDERGIPAMRSFVGDENWEDYTVEARIKVTDNSYAGLIFRTKSELEYHIFYMNVGSNVIEWWEHTEPNPDSRSNHFKHAPVENTIELNKWYTFKIIAEGDNFEFYIDDVLQEKGSDDTYPNGKVGMWAWDTKARFDDVKVTGEGIQSLSVLRIGKLTTTWSQIKNVSNN